ncbi:MAG: RHS repeat-associated core domain-containing protein [Phycisphaerae bacterium]
MNNFDINPFTSLQSSGSTAVAYEWDAENRLVAVTPVAPTTGNQKVLFKYDYLGRRIEKAVYDWDSGGSAWEAVPTEVRRFVWSGWLMLLELDGSDDVIRKYTWGLDLAGQHGSLNSLESAGGIGGLLAMEAPQTVGDPLKYVYMYDANGNVGQLVAWGSGYGGTVNYAWDTDPPGATPARLVAAYEYDPYGAVVTQSGDYAATNPFRFSTKYWDDETGLGCWPARYYDPRTGRWTSHDPKGEIGWANLYAALRNNPFAWIDPDGGEDQPASPASQPSANPPPASAPTTQAAVNHNQACCEYDVTTVSIGKPFETVDMGPWTSSSVCRKTSACPSGASDPRSCCECCGQSSKNELGRIAYSVRTLKDAKWGACCWCTVKVKRQSWYYVLPHHEFELACPASDAGPAFTRVLDRMPVNKLWGPAYIHNFTGGPSLREYTADSKRINCELGQLLKDKIDAAYPPEQQHIGDDNLLKGKHCRSFAYWWYNWVPEGIPECDP